MAQVPFPILRWPVCVQSLTLLKDPYIEKEICIVKSDFSAGSLPAHKH